MSVKGQEGLFNFPQLGCSAPRSGIMIIGTRMKWTTTVKAIGQDGLDQLCKTKKIEKIEHAPHFEEAAEQFQLVKKGKKVSWKRLDCQDEFYKSMTYKKFATKTSGEEEPEFDEVFNKYRWYLLLRVDNNSPGDMCQKKGEHEEEHRHAREGLAWRRVSIANDSGACDSVISPEHFPDHEVHESVESRRGENFQSVTGEPVSNLGDLRPPLYMREGTARDMVMKAFLGTKLLGSVKKICQAGHTLVFDDEGSFMNKNIGEVKWLGEEDGNYMLDAWVPIPQQ